MRSRWNVSPGRRRRSTAQLHAFSEASAEKME